MPKFHIPEDCNFKVIALLLSFLTVFFVSPFFFFLLLPVSHFLSFMRDSI
jgi:hypothetical protein